MEKEMKLSEDLWWKVQGSEKWRGKWS